jgi:predicted GIY-YIG superfamily endonuclease
MYPSLSIANLLKFDNNQYLGNCHNVIINENQYNFIKGYLEHSPRKYQHPLYNLKVKQAATYIIRNNITGEVYIGSSGKVYNRISRHKEMISIKKHDNSNFTKLLEAASISDFELIIIFTDTRDTAYDLEQYFMDYYKNSNLLLNIAPNARFYMSSNFTMLGRELSADHKQKISESNTGKVMSEEAKEKMSFFSKTNPTAIAQFKEILEGKKRKVSVYGIAYDSLTEAGKSSKFSESFIRRSLNRNNDSNIFYLSDNVSPIKGKPKTAEHRNKISEFKKTNAGAIAQLDSIRDLNRRKILLNGVLYGSILEAVKKTGIAESTLHRQIAKTNKKIVDGAYAINYNYPIPRKLIIDGIIYNSVKEATGLLSVSKDVLKYKLKAGIIHYLE